jgi:hypothetical protein
MSRPKTIPGEANPVDLGLAVLSAIRPQGHSLDTPTIAAACDCSYQAIQQIEYRALAKLRRRLSESSITPELKDHL